MAPYFNHCALMVKTNSIFELILPIDIFFHLNANFTLMSTKLLGYFVPRLPTGAPRLDPTGSSPVPQTQCPQPWRQIDAYGLYFLL